MSTAKAFLGRRISRFITSNGVQNFWRIAYAVRRRSMGKRPTLHYFHQNDDPYSQLLAGC